MAYCGASLAGNVELELDMVYRYGGSVEPFDLGTCALLGFNFKVKSKTDARPACVKLAAESKPDQQHAYTSNPINPPFRQEQQKLVSSNHTRIQPSYTNGTFNYVL
eukprot:g20682.t1